MSRFNQANHLGISQSTGKSPVHSTSRALLAAAACMLALLLCSCRTINDKTPPLFSALNLMDATSFDRIKIPETATTISLTGDAYLSDSIDENLCILSGEAVDKNAVLSLGEDAVGQMPHDLPALLEGYGIGIAEQRTWPDHSITSVSFENAKETGYCHLRLSCGLIDSVYVIFFNETDSGYIPCYVLINNCERQEAFAYTMFSEMAWAVYRSTSERGTGVSETTVSWLNLSKGKHELVYVEQRAEQGSFTGHTCSNESIESILQGIGDDCLHFEVAMCAELFSEDDILSCTERKTELTIYYDAAAGSFYIKLPPEAYLLTPLQLKPVSLQEYLLMFDV